MTVQADTFDKADNLEARKAKALRRLKVCMKMSQDPDPNQAAVALRHAQLIMKEFGFTECDALGVEVDNKLVKTREGFGKCYVMSALCNLIMDVFGVKAVSERNPGSADRLNIRYIGPTSRVMLAEYAHIVAWKAMQSAWENYLLAKPYLKGKNGQRQAFHVGWLESVRAKLEAIAPSAIEAQAIEAYVSKFYGRPLTVRENNSPSQLNAANYHAGVAAGEGFSIHAPVAKQQGALAKL
jgi:hypothetical protein